MTIWWAKGFYESEDNAFAKVIEDFEAETGIDVEVSLFGGEDGLIKAISAVEAGRPPDVGYGHTYDFRALNLWAYQDELDPVSDIVEPLEERLQTVAYEAVHVRNGTTDEVDIYAVPIAQSSIHIFYWKDLLEEAGFTPEDIPNEWTAFWNFWCTDVQASLRDKGHRIYGVGLPVSTAGSDTYDIFMEFLSAHQAKILDADGNLVLGEPENREGLIAALKDYVALYESGCTPASALTWANGDNNTAFHNKTTVMTPNATLSIPAKYFGEESRDTYDAIATSLFPNAVDGSPLAYRSAVKTAVVFKNAENKEAGHRFLEFLMRPENINPLVDGALGRWFPATTDGLETELWQGDDPNRAALKAQYANPMEPHPFVRNYRMMRVNAEALWGRALHSIIQDGASAEEAADKLVQRISEYVNAD
nr:ABC transporter substrate-binding protein [Acuticoccus kalidii]